jgi:hypothetical protein
VALRRRAADDRSAERQINRPLSRRNYAARIPILPPDINEERVRFTVTWPGVFGLTTIKRRHEGRVESLLPSGRNRAASGRRPLCEDRLRLVNKRVRA